MGILVPQEVAHQPQGVCVQALTGAGDDVQPVHGLGGGQNLLGLAHGRLALEFLQRLPQRLHLAGLLLQTLHQRLRRGLEELGCLVQQPTTAAHVLHGDLSGGGLDTAYTGGHTALALDAEGAGLSSVVQMSAAAQLHGEVAHGHHPHGLTILLAEGSHRAPGLSLGEGQYPDLKEKQSYITKVIRTEEENFARTIDGGIRIYNEMLASHKEKGETVFSGADAFKLYDTFGFPLDLTAEMAAEEGMTVDEDAFQSLMTQQKERAREARKALGDLGWAGVEFGKDMPATEFVGYDRDTVNGAKVLGIVAEGELVDEIVSGMEAILVLDKTPFYAEMGGQVADHGVITGDGMEFVVSDVQKNKGGKFMHYGKLVSGSLAVGDTVTASIDAARRKAIMRAHSATHLLDYALRTVLGDHAHQAGSLVEPDRLRYDFTHFSAVTADELVKISRLVSELVLDGMPVETKEMPIAEAKKLGAIALFGEKYGDVVRVVNMGGKSVELCGGTHVDNTAKVGPFRITSESSVASGVRRIEAVTGEAFLNLVDEMNMRLVKAAELLKTTPMELINKAQSSMNEIRELHQTIERMKDKLFAGDVDSLMFSAKDVNGLKVVTASRENTDANDLRKLGDFLRDKNPNTVAALGAVNGEKVTLLAVCGKNAVARGIKAGDIIKNIAPIVGGKGGGKPDSAMGGGTNALKLDDALAAVDDYVAANVKD